MLIDSHCHLDHLKTDHYPGGLTDLLAEARDCGVSKILSVAVSLESSKKLQTLAAQFDNVFISAGVHPLQKEHPRQSDLDQLIELGAHEKVIAIGETGLDYFYNRDSRHWQRESFIRHLQVAAQLDKPVIVHSRDARKETLDLISREGGTRAGVLHCFTESWEMARAALDLGYYISFSGIVTFRNADTLREVVRKVPLDRILVETDAPWLAPVPHRGQQNEPKFVVEVARCVADLQGVTLQKLASSTTDNFNRLFNL